jgi:hypothetical protein
MIPYIGPEMIDVVLNSSNTAMLRSQWLTFDVAHLLRVLSPGSVRGGPSLLPRFSLAVILSTTVSLARLALYLFTQ